MRNIFLLLLLPSLLAAQPVVFTLDECVAYALEHNTQVRQAGLSVEDARLQLHTSRYQRLPNLNASLGQSFGFGRSQGRDGSTEDVTSASTSMGISTSVPLFTGFRIPNEIRADREQLYASEQRLEAQRRDVGITVTTCYLNALYYQGRVEVARRQFSLDSLQLATAQTLVEAGRRPQSEAAEAEANMATSRLSLSVEEGNYRLALLDLRQAINYDNEAALLPAPVTDDETSALAEQYLMSDGWIGQSLDVHPSIQAARHQLRASEYQLRVARSAWYPTLTFNAGYSNSYFHSFDYPNQTFSRQLRINGSEYLGLSLNIPIFNRFATRNNVRRAKINAANLSLQLDEQRRTLHKQIEQHRVEAVNARGRVESGRAALEACETACRYEAERYAAGTTTLYALAQAQQKVASAANELLQARCELALRLHLLRYYEPR